MLLQFASLIGRVLREFIYPADKIFTIVFLIALAPTLLLWWRWPMAYRGLLRRVTTLVRRLTRRGVWAYAIVAFIPLALRALMLPVRPIPLPMVHDEFSYLLGADTFAHGRLTNPPLPVWQSFESFHILQQPTYMSMYPPAPAFSLAVGQVLFGHPFWGVFLSFGIMCSLTYWACRGWLSARWALFGAILAGLELGSGYWLNSYWGGTVAAIGGCLVIGSLGRIWGVRGAQTSARGQGVWFGLGLTILANSRPWEGMWLTFGIGLVLAYRWGMDRKVEEQRRIIQAATSCCVVLLMAGSFMGYYNWRITGNPFQLPYTLNRATYAVAPMFVWQSPSLPKEYRYDVMRRFYVDWEPTGSGSGSSRYSSPRGFASGIIARAQKMDTFLFGAGFTVLLLLFGWRCLTNVNFRILLFCLAIFTIGYTLQWYYALPHYLAPLVGLVAVIKLFLLRHLHCLRWRGRRIGLALVPPFMIAGLAAGLFGYHLPVLVHGQKPPALNDFWVMRLEVQHSVLQIPGRHLVLVQYSPTHNFHREWVYNGASIDSSLVVWARYSDAEQNRKLMEYFPDRSVWLLEPDLGLSPTKLTLLRRGSVATVVGQMDPSQP
jgi:hypothetical protein